jgi:hypothetical protein
LTIHFFGFLYLLRNHFPCAAQADRPQVSIDEAMSHTPERRRLTTALGAAGEESVVGHSVLERLGSTKIRTLVQQEFSEDLADLRLMIACRQG